MGMNTTTSLPPVCPQPGVDPSQYSEDCLYAMIYAPMATLISAQAKKTPVYVWFHGGSFYEGGASNPGLDGSKLAVATGSIVVVVQYRLGVLGWLPPSYGPVPTGNLGLSDAIAALKFVNSVISFFGGSSSITVGGQSSGGHLIRALLASPSAASLFSAATIHADPVAYGFMKNSVYQALQTNFYTSVLTNCPCVPSSTACINQVPVSTIIAAQNNFLFDGLIQEVDASVGIGEPLRPHDGDGGLIQSTMTTTYPSTKKPLLITSNRDDAAPEFGTDLPFGLPIGEFGLIVDEFVGDTRGAPLNASTFYNPCLPGLVQPYVQNGDVLREALDRYGTDALWRCPNWDLARRLAGQGWTVYVGTFEAGATYPSNAGIDLCLEPGMTCHEDEIYIIFGTTPSPTASQTALTTQIQTRLKSFMANPAVAPNAPGYPTWNPATSTNANAIQFGGSADGQLVPIFACDPSFWGTPTVPFEWQVYGE
ncbi:hypothetical protein FRB97_001279 [Tulasnella sp. 331]|nr:hypothetical protein FRB97_001279 [Tulasnella sp. 331]